jgi:hypothetical protein
LDLRKAGMWFGVCETFLAKNRWAEKNVVLGLMPNNPRGNRDQLVAKCSRRHDETLSS